MILAALGVACGPGSGTTNDDGGGSSTTAVATTTAGETTMSEPNTAGSVGATGTGSSTGEPTTTNTTTTTTMDPTTMTSESGEVSSGAPPICLLDCADPVDILQTDGETPSGLVRCADGLIHRAQAVTCVTPMAATNCLEPFDGSECTSDADCVEHGFGTCMESILCGFTAGPCGCVYGCESDADCDAGQVCLCAAEGVSARSRCVAAGCTTDDDCGGAACTASTDSIDAPAVAQFACHGADDACCSDAACEPGAECRFGVSTPGEWACDFGADCGRPLRIDGRSEMAEETARGDWRAAIDLLQVPEADVCEALARHWSWVGRAEHASVGSFARFILQLLAVGAPASLVSDAQRALADEVEHARVCFALAGAYAGREVGPGPLPAACGALAVDVAEVVRAVIEEACVGETLAALEVAEAAARAEDPAVRELLRKIADDEARHAALGWRFVGWALAQHPGLRGRAGAWFAAATRAAEARAGEWAGDVTLRRFGVVDPGLRAALVRGGLAAVVGPCAEALVAAA